MTLNRKTIINALLLLFAVVVFVLIGIKTDWHKTWQSVQNAHPIWFLASLAFMLSAHWARGARWTLLTEPAGFPLNKRRSFYAVMVGYLVNVATSRGGEFARCALAARSEKAPVEMLIGTVVTERIIDMLMLLLVCLATLLLQFEYIYGFFETYVFDGVAKVATTQNLVILAVVLGMAAVVFMWWRKRQQAKTPTNAENPSGIKGIILRFANGLNTVFKLQKPWLFLTLSAAIWVGYWLSTWCLLESLEVTSGLNALNALSVVIFASIGIAIPLPAGAGVWGAVSLGLSTVYGLSTDAAETYGFYTLAMSNLNMILIGSICYGLLYFEMQKLLKHDS